ncbi:hypothetical protein J416_01574 [Gracilibacillus halophilus YIM-C55.5]|uniref:Uncharacterized protein n=1 Tax=Gracilibacillus halophilus YIM-C55.5 TaxID=1308866 RepID=N4WUY1_9BACI|nr:hypothetical protein [Gracilibacillus halophilus]ENH98145.1 hypothetical protein J416_01574 [Gracilibacillus halophilus YIM-C55.5]
MPIQNGHEIEQLAMRSHELEHATREVRNSADIENIQALQQQLREVQEDIQDARGKAINGSGTSMEPLFKAHVRVEECQHELKRALTNLEAQQDQVSPE